MGTNRKQVAIRLRRQGLSIKAIAKNLKAAQSSVSIWVRDVELSHEQRRVLKSNTHSVETIAKRRTARLASELKKRTAIFEEARANISSISDHELWLIGTALYWAEGAKTQGTVGFSNGDPRMIELMMQYFRRICKVDEVKLRCHIHIHESLDVKAAEAYWQTVTQIPKERFYKTYNKPNKSSKGKRHSLPYGVCNIYVLNAKLLLQIKGWTQGIYDVVGNTGLEPVTS